MWKACRYFIFMVIVRFAKGDNFKLKHRVIPLYSMSIKFKWQYLTRRFGA